MKYVGRLPFESFNARTLSPDEVAESFVPPPCFLSLIGRKHTVLIGPRGSGKTTLLKMLHPAAMRAWNSPEKARVQNQINYTGVFVPFDRSWKEQLGALGRKLPAEDQEALGIAAFTTHVLRSFVSSLRQILDIDDESTGETVVGRSISRHQEVELTQSVANSWYLSPEVPTLSGLHLALTDRLSDIAELSSQASLLSEKDARNRLANETFLHLQFLAALSSGIERIENVIGELGQWALLFDELELAPTAIIDLIVRSLRSADPRFLFKLSLSPYTPNYEMTIESAMPGHDYDLLKLWYPNKEDSYKFCRGIVQQMIAGRDLEQRTVEDVFGRSVFEGETEVDSAKPTAGYHPGSAEHKRFSALAERDRSFNDYLVQHNINLDCMDQLSEPMKARVRKLAAVVTVRETFLSTISPNGEAKFRSRKNPTLYSGATVLFDASEGNPRLLIGLVDRLLDTRQDSGRVKRNRQATEIGFALARFRAYLKTIPTEKALVPIGGARGLLAFLDTIGKHFFDQVCGPEFNAEPALSFVVDSTTTDRIMDVLAQAMNAGAIIEVSGLGSTTVSGNLRGTRFRLAYLLATQHRLPLILGRAHSLREVMISSGVQRDLF